MTRLLPPVLCSDDLPAAELSAARLDGELFALGEGFAPVDGVDDAHHRGYSLAALLPSRFVAERRTAAWVHGAFLDVPRQPEFCVDIAARYRVIGPRRISVREVVFAPGDVVMRGGIQVTSPRRTAIDLLRRDGELSGADATAVIALARIESFDLQDVLDELRARTRLPGKIALIAKLELLLAQPAETR